MKLLQTENYLLLINEKAEIKENTWYENNGILFLSDSIYNKSNNPNNSNPRVTDFNNSVIAYYTLTKEAKELDLPELPNPFEEVDIEKLAKEKFPLPVKIHNRGYSYKIRKNPLKGLKKWTKAFIEGYKAAQPKQFSLDDIKKVIEMAREVDLDSVSSLYTKEEIIQSLTNQQSPQQFSLEDMRNMFILGGKHKIQNPDSFLIKMEEILESLSTRQLPKEFIPSVFYRTSCSGRIIDQKEYNGFSEQMKLQCKLYFESNNNSEGKEVLVGTYKY